jgi:hypothetical protein
VGDKNGYRIPLPELSADNQNDGGKPQALWALHFCTTVQFVTGNELSLTDKADKSNESTLPVFTSFRFLFRALIFKTP